MAIQSSVITRRLERLQVGQETTWGSAVPATSIIGDLSAGGVTITPVVKNTVVEQQRGSLVPAFNSAQLVTYGQADVKGQATFEDTLYLLGGAYGLPAPSGPGPYVWTFSPPLAATFTPLSLTMEYGVPTSATAVKMAGALLQDWSLSGEQQKEVSFTGKYFGSLPTFNVTPTAALNYRTTEIVVATTMAVAIDPAGTAAGTTPYAGSLVAFTLTGNSGLNPVFAGGSKAPISYSYGRQTLGLKVSVFYSSGIQSFMNANLLAGKPCVVQLKATSGTHAMELDFAGVLKSDPSYWEDSQGGQMVSFDLDAQYDVTDALYFKAVLTNAVSTLP